MTFEEWQEQEGFSEDYDLVRYCYEAGEKNATAAERERWRGYVVDLRQENFLLTEQSLLAEGIVQACDRMLRDMMHNE